MHDLSYSLTTYIVYQCQELKRNRTQNLRGSIVRVDHMVDVHTAYLIGCIRFLRR
jgi:hypothetical protein